MIVLGSTAAETVTLTYVTRAGRPANEVSVAGIGGYGVYVGRTIRAEGDTIEIRAGGGNDTLDASALTGTDRVAVVLRGEDGNDRIIGTPFADVLDGGDANDRVTGGAGRDTFVDSSGTDTLVETFNSDFGVYDNLFVVGTAAANGVDFTSGVVEDLAGIFEAVELHRWQRRQPLPRGRRRRLRHDRRDDPQREPVDRRRDAHPARRRRRRAGRAAPGRRHPGAHRRLRRLRPARGLGHQPAR